LLDATSKLSKDRGHASPVLNDGFVYGLDDAILASVDATTALKRKGGRYGYGQVLLASGHL